MGESITFARRVFLAAGIYGIAVLLPQYFMEDRIASDFPPAITHPEHYYGFIGVALAWQVLFLIVAGDPIRYRAAMIPSILEKVSFGVACVLLFMKGRLSSMILGFGVLDLIIGAFFVASYRITPKRG